MGIIPIKLSSSRAEANWLVEYLDFYRFASRQAKRKDGDPREYREKRRASLLPKGFIERTPHRVWGKGLGWGPQSDVLSHRQLEDCMHLGGTPRWKHWCGATIRALAVYAEQSD
ncbi:hypothetical protein Tco_1124599 [Tanacetum coccineum]|uniref:Uncharacterized protein n=1 Tax=Tanacetum coccineum TaxID=301880 RepID=A0ABQ5J6N3_9ASTR